MSKGILVDTDIVIDYLRDQARAGAFVEAHLERMFLSVITVAEVRAGIKGKAEQEKVQQFLAAFPTLDVTRKIADIGGDWVCQYGPSHSVQIPDALIAATASHHDLQLKTLNVKHYPMYKRLTPAYRKTAATGR